MEGALGSGGDGDCNGFPLLIARLWYILVVVETYTERALCLFVSKRRRSFPFQYEVALCLCKAHHLENEQAFRLWMYHSYKFPGRSRYQ